MSRGRPVKRATAVVLGCLLGLSVVELLLRTTLAPLPRPQRIVDDAVLGWDSDPAVTALTNTGAGLAVYFLGDSFTQDRAWPALTQKHAASEQVRFDGHVLGVSGYGTTQAALKLEREFDRHRPRLVLLLFFAWNDLRDNVDRPAIFYSPTTRTRPYIEGGGTASLTPARPLGPAAWLLYHTEVSRRFGLKALLRLSDVAARLNLDALARWHVPLSINYTERATWEPFYVAGAEGEYVRRAYAATEAAFRRMHNFVSARGSRLAVIGIDNPFVVDRDVADAWIRPVPGFDADLPLRRVGDMLRAMGVPFVSATPALRDRAAQLGKKMYNPPAGELSGHLEPEGEDVIGKLAVRLATALLR